MSGIRVFNAAVKQYQLHQENSLKIKARRQKTQHDSEKYDLDKKKVLLELESAKHDNKMNELDYKIHVGQVNEYFKQQKKVADGEIASQDIAESQEQQGMKQIQGVIAGLVKNDPQVQLSIAQDHVQRTFDQGVLTPVRKGKGYGFKREKVKEKKIKDSKEYIEFEMANKMAKDDTLDIETPYGDKVKKYLPKAREILYGKVDTKPKLTTQNFTKDIDEMGISTARQAVEVLVNKYGLSQEEAIAWVRENN